MNKAKYESQTKESIRRIRAKASVESNSEKAAMLFRVADYEEKLLTDTLAKWDSLPVVDLIPMRDRVATADHFSLTGSVSNAEGEAIVGEAGFKWSLMLASILYYTNSANFDRYSLSLTVTYADGSIEKVRVRRKDFL